VHFAVAYEAVGGAGRNRSRNGIYSFPRLLSNYPKRLDVSSFIRYNDFTKTMKVAKTMKQNFTEKKYVQMAKEQLCKSLKEIPFVEDIEVIPTGLQRGFGDFHAIVHFSDSEKPAHFYVEVKANGERRYANQFMLMASQHHDDACYVFRAPYIFETSAKAMREG